MRLIDDLTLDLLDRLHHVSEEPEAALVVEEVAAGVAVHEDRPPLHHLCEERLEVVLVVAEHHTHVVEDELPGELGELHRV